MTFQSSLVNRPHCSFAFPTNWFQLPLIWSVFIFVLHSVNPIVSTASVGFEFPQDFPSLWRLSRPVCEDHMARCFIPGVPRTPAPCDQPQLGFRRVAERHRRLSSAPTPESLGFPTSLRRSGRRRFGRGLRCLLSPFLASSGNGH